MDISQTGGAGPLIKTFIDEFTGAATSVPGCRWLFHGLERLITWARMSFKPGLEERKSD